MNEHHIRSFLSAALPTRVHRVCCAALVILLSSCSAELPVQQAERTGGAAHPAVAYSVVCVIHGDGDYQYHDTSGVEHAADVEALASMKKAAEDNPRAEVFIFHQRKRTHTFLFFPVADGDFYWYRSGQLVAHELYWRNEATSRYEPEAALYHRYHVAARRDTARLFLYYGHEIPEFGGEGYDASNPERQFTVQDLAAGLSMFTTRTEKFDLMILSTCFGGTPYTIGTLSPFARTIVASPDNLHLSYFDFSMLARLEQNMRDGDASAFAQRYASHSFDNLTRLVQTAVSVAVYNVDSVQRYVTAVHQAYAAALPAIEKGSHALSDIADHGDCADVPIYTMPDMSRGVIVFYRSARFGRAAVKQTHSGWECWRLNSQLQPTMQMTIPAR